MAFVTLGAALENATSSLLAKGERVSLTFYSNKSKWLRASQSAIIEWRLDQNPDIEVISIDYLQEETLTFKVEVTNTDALLTEQLIIGLILSANPSYFYLTFKPGIKKVVGGTARAVKTAAGWAPLTGVIVGAIVILYLLKK